MNVYLLCHLHFRFSEQRYRFSLRILRSISAKNRGHEYVEVFLFQELDADIFAIMYEVIYLGNSPLNLFI